MKKCFKCGVEKSLDDFYVHQQMKDGHLNKCKECSKSDAKYYVNNNRDYYREYEKQRAMLPHRVEARKKYQELHPEKKRKYIKNYKDNNPERIKANQLVNNKLRYGKLTKKPCAVCGKLKVHAHHFDYSKPLEVIWLCPKHHKEIHQK